MAGRRFLVVKVVAVHVTCGRCGESTRVEYDHEDGFTRHVLQPLGAWWVSHLEPQLVLLEVIADGEHQEWAAA